MTLTEFTDPVDGFAVKFRSAPEHTKVEVSLTPMSFGDATATADVFYERFTGQTVAAFPVPCTKDSARTPDILRGTLESTLENLGSAAATKPVIETQILTTIQSFPAIHATFTYTVSGTKITAKFLAVMHGSTVIDAIAATTSAPDPVIEEEQKTFMESFRLLDGPSTATPKC
ncbi:hypothetical protein [Arthrobacter bambusae]|uniref:hypothetical protein n=1 Tax=Arthrobacter bambusae TaxID=1338426 RepID=UPI0027D8E14A|nr:hypothetical protein [Arthrobacter bambusae]